MTPNEYQELAVSSEIYTHAAELFINDITAGSSLPTSSFAELMLKLMYCTGKMNGEAGEAAEIVFKAFRGGVLSGDDKYKLQKELGDVQWYVANIARLIGVDLEDIMKQNIEKLQDRKARGVLHGYGDER